jgi:hypothetical protein
MWPASPFHRPFTRLGVGPGPIIPSRCPSWGLRCGRDRAMMLMMELLDRFPDRHRPSSPFSSRFASSTDSMRPSCSASWRPGARARPFAFRARRVYARAQL